MQSISTATITLNINKFIRMVLALLNLIIRTDLVEVMTVVQETIKIRQFCGTLFDKTPKIWSSRYINKSSCKIVVLFNALKNYCNFTLIANMDITGITAQINKTIFMPK